MSMMEGQKKNSEILNKKTGILKLYTANQKSQKIIFVITLSTVSRRI